jgi:hypothetical protein
MGAIIPIRRVSQKKSSVIASLSRISFMEMQVKTQQQKLLLFLFIIKEFAFKSADAEKECYSLYNVF